MAIRVLTGEGSTGYRVPRMQEWLQTSPAPGVNWQQATLGVSTVWSRVRYLNGQFVAVGGNASLAVMTSPDGLSWTQRTSGLSGSNPLGDVACNGTVYVAVEGGSSTTSTTSWTSPDAITWTARTCPSGSWSSVIWFAAASLFVAVDCSTATGASSCMTSPDGITWTTRTMPSADRSWSDLATDGTYLVAVAGGDRAGHTGNATTVAAYSTNGTTWSAITMPASLAWTSVAVSGAGGTWLAVAFNGGIAAKCVGAPSGTWATAAFSIAASDVVYDATTSTFGITPVSGTSGLSVTTAMVTTTRTLANSTNWTCLAVGPQWAVALSRSVFGSSNVSPIESPTWTCPAGVTSVDVTAVGGGGGGGSGPTSGSGSAGGGGGGQAQRRTVTVVPGTAYTITVGAGGTGATGDRVSGSSGGSTSFGVSGATALVSSSGGGGGAPSNNSSTSGGANTGGGAGGNATVNICGGGGGGGAGGNASMGAPQASASLSSSYLNPGDPFSNGSGMGAGNSGSAGASSADTRVLGGAGGQGIVLNGMGFAGGGGGGYWGPGSCGGAMGTDSTSVPANALANTGGGGAGGNGQTNKAGSNGGSGYLRLDWVQ